MRWDGTDVNRLLLIDSFRRNPLALLIQAGIGAAIWIAAGAGLFTTGTALAASMALAQLSGPGLAVRMVAPREVLILPMSRTEIWRTRFCFSTAVVVCAVTTGKLLGLAASHSWQQPGPGLETIALSTVFDVVYASAFTWMFFVVPVQRPALMTFGVIVFMLSPFMPFVLSDRLPTIWSELTATSIGFIVAGSALGLLAFLGTPTVVTAPSPVAGRAALKARGGGWLPEFPRVVGLNRLLLKVWMMAAATQVGTMIVMPLGIWLFNGFAGPWSDWISSARDLGFLPFDPQANRMNVVWIWIFASVGNETIMNSLRLLRSLPLTARALTVLLLSSSFITWINAWIVLGLVHLAVFGEVPADWRISLLVGYLGGDCLMRSLQLRWNTRFWAVILILALVFPVALLGRELDWSLDLVLLILGPAALIFAAWLSHRALRTHRDAYIRKPQHGPFGTEHAG